MKYRILVVELEPAPYKYDLWNAFVQQGQFDIKVVFSRGKDWQPDGSHDFKQYPTANFEYHVYYGKGISDYFKTLGSLISALMKWRPHLVMISGYVDKAALTALILCLITHNKYTIHSDVFNNEVLGESIASKLKFFVRNAVRSVIFSTATAVLNCGDKGIKSALKAGCHEDKVFDFPYVVNKERLSTDMPESIPQECLSDVALKKTIILYSGRFIPRKGIDVLLNAIAGLQVQDNFSLWLEGQGPEYNNAVQLAEALGISSLCRFLGFSQMSLHSWLVRNADIVVVPSIRDPWGIVVDEGMQLGKPVVASDGTLSAIDRITHEKSGYIFHSGNSYELQVILTKLLLSPDLRLEVGCNAREASLEFCPGRNVMTITNILKSVETDTKNVA